MSGMFLPVPEKEEEECNNLACKQNVKNLQVTDLNKQVDTLTGALRDVSRRYWLLKKRSQPSPSSQLARVTRNLLSVLSSPGEEEGPEQPVAEPAEEPEGEVAGPSPKVSTDMPHPFPDHVAALNCLKSGAEKKDQWSFYGHLTAYWASIYGHRGGVFQNLTIKEVEDARKTESEGHFVINISADKTNQAFGAAQLALDEEEYRWLEEFLALRSTLVGGNDAKYFFFTSKPSSCKNLNKYFQEAWASMGLPGTPTFTDVRTAIATHAKNTHCPDDRHKVAQFMCHDTATADRFYALNLDAKQAAEHRRLFDAAVVGDETEEAEVSPEKATTSKRKRTTPQKLPTASPPPPAHRPPPALPMPQKARSRGINSLLNKLDL
ncbi:hypothetical protein QQF64_020537 [Cirrhinus molitorella]|uniref:Uncharacterized protein n=1 Tax=Cirrhinus molitorella TaxID=172907 RepID=A0ABR3L9J1_9TELE